MNDLENVSNSSPEYLSNAPKTEKPGMVSRLLDLLGIRKIQQVASTSHSRFSEQIKENAAQRGWFFNLFGSRKAMSPAQKTAQFAKMAKSAVANKAEIEEQIKKMTPLLKDHAKYQSQLEKYKNEPQAKAAYEKAIAILDKLTDKVVDQETIDNARKGAAAIVIAAKVRYLAAKDPSQKEDLGKLDQLEKATQELLNSNASHSDEMKKYYLKVLGSLYEPMTKIQDAMLEDKLEGYSQDDKLKLILRLAQAFNARYGESIANKVFSSDIQNKLLKSKNNREFASQLAKIEKEAKNLFGSQVIVHPIEGGDSEGETWEEVPDQIINDGQESSDVEDLVVEKLLQEQKNRKKVEENT